VNFVLVREPLGLGMMAIGFVYFVFLPSMLITPAAGWLVARLGTRTAFWGALAAAGAGLPLLVLPSVPAVLAGLVLVGAGTFFAQATATGFVGRAATGDRGSASGIYLACYFTGGLVGTALLGLLFDRFGWPACVAGIAAALALTALPAVAAEVTYTVELTGQANVPDPIKTPASGQAKLVVSADGKSVSYVLTVKDLDNAASVDLHLGSPGQNGPLVVKLFPVRGASPKEGPFSGVLAQGKFDASDLTGPLTGAPLSDLLEQIRDGNAYVNVHTNDGMDPPDSGPGDHRLGEIRGQIK